MANVFMVGVAVFALLAVFFSVRAAWQNGVVDGFGLSQEPKNPRYQRAAQFLRTTQPWADQWAGAIPPPILLPSGNHCKDCGAAEEKYPYPFIPFATEDGFVLYCQECFIKHYLPAEGEPSVEEMTERLRALHEGLPLKRFRP